MANEDDTDDLFSTPDPWEEEHPDDDAEGDDQETDEDDDPSSLGGLIRVYLEQALEPVTPSGKSIQGLVEIISEREWFDPKYANAALLRCFVLAFIMRMKEMGQEITPEWLGQSVIEAARADLKAQREAN